MISFLYNLISLNTPSELYFKSKSQRSSTLNQCDEHNYQISATICVLIFVLHDGKHVDVGPIDSPGRRYMIECFNNLHVTQFRSPCHCDFINIYSQSIQGVSKKATFLMLNISKMVLSNQLSFQYVIQYCHTILTSLILAFYDFLEQRY